MNSLLHFLPTVEGDFSVRIVEDAESPRLGQLLNAAFTVPAGFDYLTDFPIWSRTRPDTLRVAAFSGDQVISSACARLVQLKVDSKLIPVGLIGAVATSEIARGKGLGSLLVKKAVQSLERAGAHAVMLWGNDQGMYQQLGFEPKGIQKIVPLAQHVTSPEIPLGVSVGWDDRLLPLMMTRNSGIVRTLGDREWLSSHKNTDFVWTASHGGIVAYCAYGRGIDLGSTVHEWAGPTPLIQQLLDVIVQADPKAQIMAPPTQLDALCISHAEIQPSSVALVRELRGSIPESFWIWGLDAV